MKICLLSLLALATLPSIFGLHFGVSNSTTHKFCLVLEANINGTLTFPNKANSTTTVEFTVPEDGSVDLNTDASFCGAAMEQIQLDFVPVLKPEVPSTEIQENDDTVPYVYPMKAKFKPGWKASTALHYGFVCSQNQLPLNLTNASIQFNKLKVLAFVEQDDDKFKTNQHFEKCMLDFAYSVIRFHVIGSLIGLAITVLVCIFCRPGAPPPPVRFMNVNGI